jgi:CheY-like chemotaxis protein
MKEDQKARRVLIVEDEMIIALMIEQMVKNLGHSVVGKVMSGEDAVEAALNHKPDVILMDIRLDGDMDGIQAMSEIRKEVDIPVIFITGNSDDLYKRRIEESEYQGYLTKPITVYDLNQSFNFAS